MQIIYELFDKPALDFFRVIRYNVTANGRGGSRGARSAAFVSTWTGIEVVITALTRNQVVSQEARGFESHPVRQNRIAILTKIAILLFYMEIEESSKERVIVVYRDKSYNENTQIS